jgi:DHA2 family multidrug resistance protein-like MFS transporter
VLVGFFVWERALTRRPGGQPLLDLTLFESASFTWGVILAATAVLAMIGVLFTMPQYFQGVVGTDAMGSGLRLLPLIAGLVVGAVPADRVAAAAGTKFAAAAGFAILGGGLFLGTRTSAASGGAFVASWMAVVGVGMGLALATSSSAALAELEQERSGVGSAVLQAVNKVGGPFGTAILGSVLSSGYLARVDVSGLAGASATAVRQSIFGGVAIAHQIGSAPLLLSVRTAFVHGMDAALLISAVIALAGVVLTLLFLPRRSASNVPVQATGSRDGEVARTP